MTGRFSVFANVSSHCTMFINIANQRFQSTLIFVLDFSGIYSGYPSIQILVTALIIKTQIKQAMF